MCAQAPRWMLLRWASRVDASGSSPPLFKIRRVVGVPHANNTITEYWLVLDKEGGGCITLSPHPGPQVTCAMDFAELQLRFGGLLETERLRDSCYGLVHMTVLLSQGPPLP